jgi:biofilm PGA synthesis N-glycosyltransferase PgaC
MKKHYYSVNTKFAFSQVVSLLWVALSIVLSVPWLKELGSKIGFIPALIIIAFVAYVPGYLIAFAVISLLIDRQPRLKTENIKEPITVMIAAFNEEKIIGETLRHLKKQDYAGEIKVLLVNNNSTDKTVEIAQETAEEIGLKLTVINEEKCGKSFALNKGLNFIDTRYFITVDADTLLHPKAIKNIVSRALQSPENVCAVAGRVLVHNSRANLLARLQEWDYFLGIGAIKSIQGLYQGTLVAQGAFSLYRTAVVKEVGGWPDAIGEDIVLTWKFFEHGYKVYHEPRAIAFTEVPEKFKHFSKQRSRWARGMIEGLKSSGPLTHSRFLSRYLTAIDVLIPIIDIVYTFVWIPGLVLALFGHYYIVGPYTLLVLPLSFFAAFIMYRSQRKSFNALNLTVRKNPFGFLMYVLFFQMIVSPVSVLGYFGEVFKLQRVW